MISKRATAIGSVLALALAAAPISSAFASDRHHGGYGHGGGYRGGHGGGYGYGFNPVVGLATALVGAAAAIVTAPIAIVAAVANAPYYGPGPDYPAAPAAYNAPPVAQGYYGAPAAPAYYGPPPSGPAYYGSARGSLLQSARHSLLPRRVYAPPVAALRLAAGPRLLRSSRSWLLIGPPAETTRTTTATRPAPMVRPRGNTTIGDKRRAG